MSYSAEIIDYKGKEAVALTAGKYKAIVAPFLGSNVIRMQDVENDIETINLLKNEFDLELVKILQEQIEVLDKRIENLEISLLLSGKYDSFDAIVEIHSGAGGTEAGASDKGAGTAYAGTGHE